MMKKRDLKIDTMLKSISKHWLGKYDLMIQAIDPEFAKLMQSEIAFMKPYNS